jgi:hypothetical protein
MNRPGYSVQDGFIIQAIDIANGRRISRTPTERQEWAQSSIDGGEAPEYARGLEFPEKPVAVINASQRATCADAHLRLTLATMSARLVEVASITMPLLGRNLDADGGGASTAITAVGLFVIAISFPFGGGMLPHSEPRLCHHTTHGLRGKRAVSSVQNSRVLRIF